LVRKKPILFCSWSIYCNAYAGLIEIVPNFAEASRPVKGLKPYSVLELAGKERV